MGQKNAVTKRFCGDKIRFADLVNGLYFQGREVVQAEELSDAGEFYAEPDDAGMDERQREYLERSRDIKMRHSNGGVIRIFGEDTDAFSKCFADYPFRLYCVNEEQDFSIFHTDVRTVFELLPLRKDKKRLLEKLEGNKEYTHMTEDSLEFLSVVMDSPRLWKERAKYMNKDTSENNKKEMEEYDVCQAIRELIEDGRQEGRLEGKKEGHLEALKLSTENLMKSLSISLEKACELLCITEECDRLRKMMD